MVSPSQTKQPLHRGIGEAAHPVGLELLAPPVTHVDRDAAERESNDDKARQRHATASNPDGTDDAERSIVGSGVTEAAPMAVK